MTADDKPLKGQGVTLTEADIASQRVSRRSLLTTLGLGAGVAAATVVGATRSQAYHTRDSPDWGRHCQPICCTQADPNDPHDPRSYCSDND